MAYIPPVNIPSLGGKNYARDLYDMISGVGEAYYGAKRDKIGDQQWAAEQERLNTAQALAQSNADRNYALELQRFEADQAAGAAGGSEYGLNPIWGYNPETGSYGVFQPSKAGGAPQQMQFPDGFSPVPSTSNVNLGTHYQPMGRGGIPVGVPQPIDNSGKAYDTTVGGAAGTASVTLPTAINTGTRIVSEIDDLLAPGSGLDLITGQVGGMVPNVVQNVASGGRAGVAQSRLDLILGNTFLQAYNDLRGAGSISQQEGQAAMAAYNRLRTQTMDDASYREALLDFKFEVQKLMELAMQRAQRPGVAPGPDAGQPQGQQPVFTSPGGFQVFEE